MSCSLKYPCKAYVPPSSPETADADVDIKSVFDVMKKKRKRKSPSKKKRDLERAISFRKRKTQINLPFTGQLLPVNRVCRESGNEAASCDLPSLLVQVTPNLSGQLTPHKIPVKKLNTRNDDFTEEIGSIKKQLFPSPSNTLTAERVAPQQQNYRRRENDLWAKIFN